MTRCRYDPKELAGAPIGMHHCPDCGCMVIAAMDHGPCEDDCPKQDDGDRASMDQEYELMGDDDGR